MDLYVLWSLLFCLINVSFICRIIFDKKLREDSDLSVLFFIYLVIFLEFHWFALVETQ